MSNPFAWAPNKRKPVGDPTGPPSPDAAGGNPFDVPGLWANADYGRKLDSAQGQGEAVRNEFGALSGERKYRAGREHTLNTAYDTALLDPTGTADQFSKYFQQEAQGLSAPALRDFSQTQAGLSGSIASRFGGNASGEEGRQLSNAGDLFSRNLTEALARLAPQAISAGQAYTGQLGQAAGAAGAGTDQLSQMILSGILGTPQKKSALDTIGGVLGGVVGAATKFL